MILPLFTLLTSLWWAIPLMAQPPGTFIYNCSYTASNTDNAAENYASCFIDICPGETVTFDGCSCRDDTIFRLYDEEMMTEVAFNDDACGDCSAVKYTLTSGHCHLYNLHMGCLNMTSCYAHVNIFKSFPKVEVHYDGPRSSLNFVAAPTDEITFTASYPPFYLKSNRFFAFNASSYQIPPNIDPEGSIFSYDITDSLGRFDAGNMTVRTPQYFNQSNAYYYLMPGEFLRWYWEEGTAPVDYPTYFYAEFNSQPGWSRTGANSYDFIFTVPGGYYWSNSWNMSYYVMVFDSFDGLVPHHNIKWGAYQNEYAYQGHKGEYLIFYVSDGNKQNVRIINSVTYETVWVSRDLMVPGEYDLVLLPPGQYYAISDHDSWPYMYFIITDGDDKNKKDKLSQLIPQPYLRVAEISLFVLGVIGITDALFNWAPKPSKLPPAPVGDHISLNALNGVKKDALAHPSD